MKVYLPGYVPPANSLFAGEIGTRSADVADCVGAIGGLESQLIALGKLLVAQYDSKETRDSRHRVVGVEFKGIEFSLLLDPIEGRRR